VLTWTTGEKETIIFRDVEELKVEPLWEETLTFVERGPRGRLCYKSEGRTALDPSGCPCCYDGLSFKSFSEIVLDLDVDSDFYLNWEHVTSGKQFTYR
jgi:hypothetical protein